MADEKTTPKPTPKPAPKPDDGPADGGQVADVRADTAADRTRRRHELAAELARLDADDARTAADTSTPTHTLTLSNGERVESHGTVSTHHTTADGVFRVVGIEPVSNG